jgi:TolB protein
MNADGSGNPVQLTSNACTNQPYNCDFAPAWSPFGDKIAFCSIRPGSTQVWIMNSDGSGLTQLTTTLNLGDTGAAGQSPGNEDEDCRLAWSPDETKIAVTGITAYLPDPPESPHNVYVINADGTNLTQLTDCHLNYPFVSDCDSPDWSPDGTLIAFSDDDVTWGDNYGGAGIYTILASDGSSRPFFNN